ncbi:hypothetical protein MRY87_03510 [bacterium]|nr:hypothetical protein [bacterium]
MNCREAQSYAKLNLSLRITGRRSDGFHLLSLLNVRIGVADTVRCEFSDEPSEARGVAPSRVELSGRFADSVPNDRRNLALQAVALFQDEVVRRGLSVVPLVRLGLEKEVPVGAGCGGGSSNAATVLLLMNEHLTVREGGQGIPFERLLQLGAELGADVPYLLTEGPAVVKGVGEEVTPAVVPYLAGLPCALITGLPPLSSQEVYDDFRVISRASSFVFSEELSVFEELSASFPPSYKELLGCIGNDLEGSARRCCPPLGPLLDELRGVFGVRAGLTGSGSALFVLPSEEEMAFSSTDKEHIFTAVERHGGEVQQTELSP